MQFWRKEQPYSIKSIWLTSRQQPSNGIIKKPLFRRLDTHAPKQNTVALWRFWNNKFQAAVFFKKWDCGGVWKSPFLRIRRLSERYCRILVPFASPYPAKKKPTRPARSVRRWMRNLTVYKWICHFMRLHNLMSHRRILFVRLLDTLSRGAGKLPWVPLSTSPRFGHSFTQHRNGGL